MFERLQDSMCEPDCLCMLLVSCLCVLLWSEVHSLHLLDFFQSSLRSNLSLSKPCSHMCKKMANTVELLSRVIPGWSGRSDWRSSIRSLALQVALWIDVLYFISEAILVKFLVH